MPADAPTEEERERGRSYLISQSAKYGLLDLWPRIAGARLEYLQAIEGLSDAQARWSAAPGEWNILDVTRHLVTWTNGVVEVCRALIDGSAPPDLRVGDLGDLEYADIDAARRALLRTSVNTAALIAIDDSLIDPIATHPHEYFGPLKVKAWLLFLRVHDLDHLAQIRALKAAPGFAAAGTAWEA